MALLPAGALAEGCIPSFGPVCKFSVNGKKGRFLANVDDKKLDAIDASLQVGEGKGLSESSLNKGAFYSTGLPMPHTEAAVSALVSRLESGWTHRPIGPIVIHLIGDTSYAARAKPDNSIVVPLGVISRATYDDEVAWVLAHEFSHTALRHYARTAALNQRQHAAETLLRVAETGLDIAQERVAQNGNSFRFYAAADPEAAKRRDEAWSRGQQLRQVMLLGDALASREQEDEADVMGYDLARAAGFDADTGATTGLQVAGEDDKRAAARTKGLQEKMTGALRQSVTQSDVARVVQGGDLAGTMKSIGATFLKKALFLGTEQLIGFLSQNHRPASIRIKGVSAYAETAYKSDTSPPIEPKKVWLKAVTSDPEFVEAMQTVNAHDAALQDLDGGDTKKALEDIQPAIKGRYRNTPLVLNVVARVYDGLGDFTNADRSYVLAEQAGLPPIVVTPGAAAVRGGAGGRGRRGPTKVAVKVMVKAASSLLPPSAHPSDRLPTNWFLSQSLSGYNEHVLLLIRHGDYARAKTTIGDAEHRFGDHKRFLPALINIAARTQDKTSMMANLDECLESEDESLRGECREALFNDQDLKTVNEMAPDQRAELDDKLDRLSNEHSRASWLGQFSGKPASVAPAKALP